MPILNDRNRRLAFQCGRQSGIRAGNGAFDQVSDQLRAERATVRELEAEVVVLRRDLAAAQLALTRRDLRDTFAAASSPSASVH
jgi:multidrug efflux pump subunit AcrA (membrane-fusion protein)